MVTSLDNKPRKVRQWYKKHVYMVYEFRILFDQKQSIADPNSGEKKEIERRMKHLQKKIGQHADYGEFLGLSGEEIRKFSLAIIEETKIKTNPQVIIQTLTSGQK